MFTSLLSGRRLSPVSAYIAATRKCHLKCWHCSFKGHAQADMSADQLGRIIDQLVDLGTSIIGFTGGEPMLCKELKTHIAHAHRLGTATVLFTTGLNIDRDEAVRLRDAGLDIFCCSLDGEEADHDRLRGRTGAFKTTLQAIEYAKAAGMYTMLSSVADRHFIADKVYLRLYDVAASMGVDEYRLIEAMPCGRLAGSQEDVLLSPADVAELRAFHVAVNRKYRLPKVCAFNQIESPELIGCGAGTQHMFIDNAGQVCPCDFTPLSFGDATAEPLGTIWERMNAAFTLPRRDCFIQTNRDKVAAAVRENSGVIPLPVQKSQAICAACPFDGMPDYFRLVAGHLEQKI
ncbi:MAG: radical SAM protein [Alphaproteobacteria bacterium]|nr:radical SAM protein [Alphaproteobacteria bacterium]